MEKLTIQAYQNYQWHDIALLKFLNAEQNDYDHVQVDYMRHYALANLGRDDECAVSINHPVSLFFDFNTEGWLSFLDDLIPSGASRRFWIKHLGISDLSHSEKNFILLKKATIAPVGHLRIKEAVPSEEEVMDDLFFSIDEVINRGSNFLDYAAHRGAIAGGATGAGGEAPKLLLRYSKEKGIWIDTLQDNCTVQDIHYLVKYPRGARTEVDCNILRTEYYYYHILNELGFNTIDTRLMRLEEGVSYPSLWLPKFDVRFNQSGKLERVAMESVYSMLKKGPGSYLEHNQTIRTLIKIIEQSDVVVNQQFKFDKEAFVIEWVKRDLLNILFGNSDNHGRNTAFIRYKGEIKLAPIYDFAPMAADPEGVVRTIKWPKNCELGGRYHFHLIVDLLSDLVNPDKLLAELREVAYKCINLETKLAEKGVPKQILTHPNIAFFAIRDRLNVWGLLG